MNEKEVMKILENALNNKMSYEDCNFVCEYIMELQSNLRETFIKIRDIAEEKLKEYTF